MLDAVSVSALLQECADVRARGVSLSPSEIFDLGERLMQQPAKASGIGAQRIAILSSLTADFIARAIAVGAAMERTAPDLYVAPFGSYSQELLDTGSALHRFAPDLIVIAPDWRECVADLPLLASAEDVTKAVEGRAQFFKALWRAASKGGARIIQHLLAPPSLNYGGLADRLNPASPASQIAALNSAIIREGRGMVTFLDMPGLASEIGTNAFSPDRFYYQGRLPFDTKHLPAYLNYFRSAWRQAMSRTKKVLVLDLDNTLWGGVIGDDGPSGIKIGPGSGKGEAFAEWQSYILEMRNRGVILAICSKNDPAIAQEGLNHPAGILRPVHFAAQEVSWENKADGLRRLATRLNVGLDSFVFCDDNQAECHIISREMAEVEVICVGRNPAEFRRLLDCGRWFDRDSYTSEDAQRGAMYAARAQVIEERENATDLEGYLRSLAMVGRVDFLCGADLPRAAQLEMKTNQFNLTTRRYSEEALRTFMADPSRIVLTFRLRDRFGDHGLVSTLIAVREAEALYIDSWVMSCRVFSRTAESFMLRALAQIAADRGAASISGTYCATSKNGVVADLYERMGFGADAGKWILPLDRVTERLPQTAIRGDQ